MTGKLDCRRTTNDGNFQCTASNLVSQSYQNMCLLVRIVLLFSYAGKQIGSGCFGRVFKAEAVGLRNCSGTLKTVAVKMVRSKRNVVALEALERELKILIHLGWHLNVLNLLGACTIGKAKGNYFSSKISRNRVSLFG